MKTPEQKIDEIVELLKQLSDDERMKVFNRFCTKCGNANSVCCCWNDD